MTVLKMSELFPEEKAKPISVNLNLLPKSDSNQEAITNGLVLGDVYITTTGEVRVVV